MSRVSQRFSVVSILKMGILRLLRKSHCWKVQSSRQLSYSTVTQSPVQSRTRQQGLAFRAELWVTSVVWWAGTLQ